MISLIVFSLMAVLSHRPIVLAKEATWREFAADLRNEEKREDARKKLEKIPDLEKKIEKALRTSTEKGHALLVIQTLKMKSSLPSLLENLNRDVDGRILNAIFELTEIPDNDVIMRKLQAVWKRADQLPYGQRIVFLERGLSSEFPLSDKLFDTWISDQDFDLRIALARREIADSQMQRPHRKRWSVLLATNPYQVRWEMIASSLNLPQLKLEIKNAILKSCQTEQHEEVSALCRKRKVSRAL